MDNGYRDIHIIEKRDHVAGNCYDYLDEKTNVLMNKYGAHIFHTNDEEVYSFLSKYTTWIPYVHKVKAKINENTYVPIPVNINTVNRLMNQSINSEEEMKTWLHNNQVQYESILNSEQMAKNRVGNELYDILFKNYTKKQWDKYPEELDSSVLARIPVRTNFEDGYFMDKYQCLPIYGYTKMIQSMLDHPNIHIHLNTDYKDFMFSTFHMIFYTGPIDKYFHTIGLPSLEYRSINFIKEYTNQTYQPYAVVNYPTIDIPFTRTVEYKHFPNQPIQTNGSVIVHELTTDDGEPYYPVPNKENQILYEKYKEQIHRLNNISFVGRLATYKYLNMDQAVRLALDEVDLFLKK